MWCKLGAGSRGLSALVFSVWLAGCHDCEEETAAAEQFLTTPANLSCQTDADCTVVSTGCGRPPSSSSGQAVLNRTAAASDRWKLLQSNLSNCEDTCLQSAILVNSSCSSGVCGIKQY